MGWLSHHGEEATHAALDPVMDGLKEEGVSKFAAVGYCFGVRTGVTYSALRLRTDLILSLLECRANTLFVSPSKSESRSV